MADVQRVSPKARGDHTLCAGMAMVAAAVVMLYCLAVMFGLV